MTGTTDWVSALAILAAGLILGSMFIYFFARRKKTATADTDIVLRDLEGKRDSFVRQIRELDDVGSKLTPQQLAEERTRLELETAQVLRQIDAQKRSGAKPAKSEREPVVAARRPAMVGFAWGAGSMLALALLGYFVMQAARPREEAQQPQAMGQAPQPAVDPAVRALEQAVQKNPDDLKMRLQLAQAYLERENLMGVFEQTQYVLSKSPNDSRALTYQALVRMSMGQGPEAIEMLQQATKVDPNLLDAWVALAWVHTQGGKFKEAEQAMQEAMNRHPEDKGRLEEILKQMKAHQSVDMQRPAATKAEALPEGHPPLGEPAPAAAVASGDGAIRITLDIDPSAKARAGTGVVYVIARPEGMSSGPPVAVKRIPSTSLPITFDFGTADSMMGQPLPAKVHLEARLDTDGDAATKTPTDPFASKDSVATGSTIKLALK